jgi:hypothetical protein
MLVIFSLPEFNLKKQMCSSWAFHVDDLSGSSSTYDMITVTWDIDTIPMKDIDMHFIISRGPD